MKSVVIALCLFLGLAGAAAAQTQGQAPPDARTRCQELAGGRFTDLKSAPTWIVSSTFVAAKDKMPAYCDVQGYVNPTVNFGIWLPADEAWNGKFMFRGCGGSCGTVYTSRSCPGHVRDGYACVHTDMGHRSTLSDNNWAANNLQGQVDFGYRATHVTTLASKAIIAAFYGSGPKLSYFYACSTGGRQGLVEAQRFPKDFDGIVVIAPAAGFSEDFEAQRAAIETVNQGPDGAPILRARDAYLLNKGAMAACDKDDGVADRLITDPGRCRFDPAAIRCKTPGAADCLTPEKVEAARRIYAMGAVPGSEHDWMGKYIKYPPIPGLRAPVTYSQSRGDPVIINTLNEPSNPDLRRFKANGGKLIMVHGWDDPQIDAARSTAYYDITTVTMGGPEKTREFFRYFLVPGMEHCSTGHGAYGIDYLKAIEDWREKGLAPDKLVGVHPKPNAPLDFFNVDLKFLDKSWYAFTRPHFAYPKRAVYSGKGDPNLESSFVAK